MKAIVISFDSWHAGFLGLSGNPWVDTPALDAFAAGSAVFDQHFAENLSAGARQHAWWTGRYQFPLTSEQQKREPGWLKQIQEHGIYSCLLHDPCALLPLNPALFSTARAVSLEDSQQLHFEEDAPKFVKTAVQRIQQMGRKPDLSELFWIHAGGLPVDAHSLAYEERYADDVDPQNEARASQSDQAPDEEDELESEDGDQEEDTEADDETTDEIADEEEETIVFPPRFWRRARSSPRELADASLRSEGWKSSISATGRSAAAVDSPLPAVDWQLRRDLYSGQVTQWDAWVGKIIDAALQLAESTPLMIVFTAAAGQHLGEHSDSRLPPVLFEESIRVPLIIHIPQTDPFAGRRLALSTAADLPATLLDWFQVAKPDGVVWDGTSLLPVIQEDQSLERQVVFAGSDTHGGARTREFYFRQNTGSQPEDRIEGESVYVKPDDRWDADNMVRQLPDAADALRAQWKAFSEQIRERADVT
jgi:arylsulfatase A-like enzyme